MTSPQPTEQPLAQPQAAVKPESKQQWKTPELWAAFAAVLVLVPVASYVEHAALDADASDWLIAAVATVISVTSFVFLHQGSGRARDGVLFGCWMMSLLIAVEYAAKVLDMSQVLLIWLLLIPMGTAKLWGHYRRNRETSTSEDRTGATS